MKKIAKIIGVSVAILVVVLLVAMFVITRFYKDDIMHVVTDRIGSQIKADIVIEQVDLSFLGNIPNISIQLHNVYMKSTPTFNTENFQNIETDTALFARTILLSFNVLDFLFENYVVQEIVVHDANVNFFMDKKSHHNWDVSFESDSTEGDMFFELSKIRFTNTLASYHNAKSNMYVSEWFDRIKFSGKFQGDDFFVDAFAAFTNKNCSINNKSYFEKSSFKCDVSLLREGQSYIVKKLKLENPLGLILSEGTVEIPENQDCNVNLNVNIETNLSKIFTILPSKIVDSLAPYKLKAEIFVDGNVQGKIGDKIMPALVCNLSCRDVSVLFEGTKYKGLTKGSVKAKDLAKLTTYEYQSSNTTISTGNSSFTTTLFVIRNFEKPIVQIDGIVDVTFADIPQMANIDEYSINGNVNGHLLGEGSLEAITNFDKDYFKRVKFEADLRCRDVNVSAPTNSPYNFSNVTGHVTLVDGNISVDSLTGTLQMQSFTLQGKASNFISYLAFDDVDTYCNLNCTIEKIDLTPFYNHYESLTGSGGTGKFLGSIRFDAQELAFEPYFLKNAATTIRFTENAIEFSDINAATLQGRLIGGAFKLSDLPNGNTKCTASGVIEKMSAQEIFKTFNNFDQSVITSEQLNGTLSGSFQFSSTLDTAYSPLYSTTDALADIVIENGSVKNVETLSAIGEKIKMQEDFSSVSFSTLKNTIRLQHDTLYIPDMKINSNAFELNFAGKHNIEDNNFNYYVTVFLKKTLSTKFHNKHKNEEDFGEIEKNSDGNFKIPFKIWGNPDDYEINIDLKKTTQNVRASMNEQKSEWQEILHKEKNDEENQSVSPKKEEKIETDFQLEWD